MPSKSKKQRRFMAAAANNPDFARRAGIKQSVAKEFHNADRRDGMQQGGLAQLAKQRFGGYSPPTAGRGGFTPGPMPQRRPMPQINRGSMGGYDGGGINPQAGRGGWGGPQSQGGGMLSRFAQMVQSMRGQMPQAPQNPRGGNFPMNLQNHPAMQQGNPTQRQFAPTMQQPQMSTGLLARMQGAAGQFQGAQGQPMPGGVPGGALSQIAGAAGALRQPSAPQRAPVAQSRFRTGTMQGRAPNALQRTSQAPQQQYRQRLNHMAGGLRFAKGGSVKRALKRLQNARNMLQDSDPDFDHIASLIDKDLPEAKGLGSMVRKAQSRKDWQAVEKRIRQIEKDLKAKTSE